MEDADAAAMAEAMGFSSFGTQKSNKRQKFNPDADAVVASNFGGGPVSSGSNNTPLGTRTQNNDEIALDLDDDDDEGGGAAATRDTIDDDDPAPQYLDTSRPAAPANANAELGDGLQAKIDTIVGAYHGGHTHPPTLPVFNPSVSGGRGGRGSHQSARGKDRDQGKKWWEDYYDPSSNINPWERLEKDQSLKPRGQWMSWEEAKR